MSRPLPQTDLEVLRMIAAAPIAMLGDMDDFQGWMEKRHAWSQNVIVYLKRSGAKGRPCYFFVDAR